jgi:Cdc6-like AAA superfamily ATPase
MNASLEKLFESLKDTKRTITQIAGTSWVGKTTLLMFIADFYMSVGKQILYISYSEVKPDYYAERYRMLSLLSDKITYVTNSDLEVLIKRFSEKKFNADKIVILIDDFDQLPTPQLMGAVEKKKAYFSHLLNELIKHSSHIIFTNTCKLNFKDGWKNGDDISMITSIKIPVHYAVILEEKFKLDDDITARFLRAKRIHKISNLNF